MNESVSIIIDLQCHQLLQSFVCCPQFLLWFQTTVNTIAHSLHLQIHSHQIREDSRRLHRMVTMNEILPQQSDIGILCFKHSRSLPEQWRRCRTIVMVVQRRREEEDDNPETSGDRVSNDPPITQLLDLFEIRKELFTTHQLPCCFVAFQLNERNRQLIIAISLSSVVWCGCVGEMLPAMAQQSTIGRARGCWERSRVGHWSCTGSYEWSARENRKRATIEERQRR